MKTEANYELYRDRDDIAKKVIDILDRFDDPLEKSWICSMSWWRLVSDKYNLSYISELRRIFVSINSMYNRKHKFISDEQRYKVRWRLLHLKKIDNDLKEFIRYTFKNLVVIEEVY